MKAPWCAGVDPSADHVFLCGRERFEAVGRRHDFLRILGSVTIIQRAVVAATGNDGVAGVSFEFRIRLVVQSEFGLAMSGVGAMAGETIFREQRQYFAAEIGNGFGMNDRRAKKEARHNKTAG